MPYRIVKDAVSAAGSPVPWCEIRNSEFHDIDDQAARFAGQRTDGILRSMPTVEYDRLNAKIRLDQQPFRFQHRPAVQVVRSQNRQRKFGQKDSGALDVGATFCQFNRIAGGNAAQYVLKLIGARLNLERSRTNWGCAN